ncbi:hypothetical protein GM708_02025 [Vibrio cholerae]|nr:hypothetical protein [Vibrio cholerae]
MSESNNILPLGTDADLQEQARPAITDDGAEDAGSTREGTGGSEADVQEQSASVHNDLEDGVIAGEGTGGSEADRLEQASTVPMDGEDAFPRADTGDDPVA